MTIETKYNIGDEVYYKRFGEIYKLRITGVKVIEKAPISSVEYYVVEDNDSISMLIAEQLLSPTKEELLKSL
jgi:hypothetical protein